MISTARSNTVKNKKHISHKISVNKGRHILGLDVEEHHKK